MINIVVCDDDSDDLSAVVTILSDILWEHEIQYDMQTYTSPIDLLNQTEKADIAILDISMNGFDGLEVGRRFNAMFPGIKIIYITSYQEYCIQAVNVIHAFSFLCKPLQKAEMEKQVLDLLEEFTQTEGIEKTFYRVSNSLGHEFSSFQLNLSDILYFEYIKSKRKIAIILSDMEYEFAYVMQKLTSELEEYGFAVNCRGSLVNLKHIVKIKGYQIHLDNGKILALSQKRAVAFKEKMNQFIHKNI